MENEGKKKGKKLERAKMGAKEGPHLLRCVAKRNGPSICPSEKGN